MYISEVGGVSPTGKSYSFRVVRACERARRGEAACGRETMFLLDWVLAQMISRNRVLSMRMCV